MDKLISIESHDFYVEEFFGLVNSAAHSYHKMHVVSEGIWVFLQRAVYIRVHDC